MSGRIQLDEPDTGLIVRASLPILARLKARDVQWEQERERSRRMRTQDRDFDWQSYCRHGSFIGDPYGADYLCHLCEDGLSVYDEALAEGRQIVVKRLKAIVALHELRDQGIITLPRDWDIFHAVYFSTERSESEREGQ